MLSLTWNKRKILFQNLRLNFQNEITIDMEPTNNRFNLTNPLAWLCAVEDEAQTAPSPTGADLQVKRMLGRRRFSGAGIAAYRRQNEVASTFIKSLKYNGESL